MLAKNTIISRAVWFTVGFAFPYVVVYGLAGIPGLEPLREFVAWPGRFVEPLIAQLNRWGWEIIILVLFAGVFWGLIFMLIGWTIDTVKNISTKA